MVFIILGILFLLLFLLLLIILIRSHFERKMLVTHPYIISNERIPEEFDGFKIVYLSDLHDAFFGEDNQNLISEILSNEPDLLLFGGDMMTVKEWKDGSFESLKCLLEGLPKDLLKIYVDGNHELRMKAYPVLYPNWYERFLSILSEHQILHLQNESTVINRNGKSIRIYGVDIDKIFYKKGFHKMSPYYIESKVGKCNEEFNIVLSHMPMYLKNFSMWGADLVLSGHFHGGTIRLPLLGGLMSPQFQFFSKYCRGRLTYGNTTEVVSGGLGTHSVNIRFNNKPEILLLTLQRKI